jgi:hypothetical protein
MFRSCHCRGRDLDGHFDETDLLDMGFCCRYILVVEHLLHLHGSRSRSFASSSSAYPFVVF